MAHCANVGLATSDLQVVFNSPTAEAALKYLRLRDATTNSNFVNQVYSAIAEEIDTRSLKYILDHSSESQTKPMIGSILFDRDREIIVKSQTACTLITKLC